MSYCLRAIVAATSAVSPPTQATATSALPPAIMSSQKSGMVRATRYTPAVTIVAAWIRAETGVGPSIASGSHVNRGSWALFPQAPMNRNHGMR